jgi:arylsulfatase A-like enzyme
MTTCSKRHRPNVVFVLADQWRAQDVGYAGNAQVQTPNLDRLAAQSLVFENAVSGCPVCSPYRASLMTGQYPLTHGLFYNDKPLRPKGKTLGECFKEAGYETAYIGKWHINGHEKGGSVNDGRTKPVPAHRRFGFDFWKVHECTHDYNNSVYFDETNQPHKWQGYDAIAQTRMAQDYMKEHHGQNPFFLFLSWGPPHAPYHTAPEHCRALYPKTSEIQLRPNVPDDLKEKARRDIAGYYAHIAALDDCIGELWRSLKENGLEDNTILIFTSDHGDMLYSHGQVKKQKPWDESIRVPLLVHYSQLPSTRLQKPITTPDIMPTLLSLCDISIPNSVEGKNRAELLLGREQDGDDAVLIECPVPFHQWSYKNGGREYRGLRTTKYTYARDLNGPWLLYDNATDEFQLNNLINNPAYVDVLQTLDELLTHKLIERQDEFFPGDYYMTKWNYDWDGDDAQKQ